jgi:hypothetical protein
VTAQIFYPRTGRRYLVHVLSDGGYNFIGMVTGHDEETVTMAPCRHINAEASALMVVALPDSVTVSRLDAAFEEWL